MTELKELKEEGTEPLCLDTLRRITQSNKES